MEVRKWDCVPVPVLRRRFRSTYDGTVGCWPSVHTDATAPQRSHAGSQRGAFRVFRYVRIIHPNGLHVLRVVGRTNGIRLGRSRRSVVDQ